MLSGMMVRMKAGLRKNMLNVSMLLIAFLAVMSINGAFLGAERATVFFNSIPMAIAWCVLLVVLVASLFLFPSLRKRTSLLTLHVGCCLVVAGGLCGSGWSHQHFGKLPLSKGFMLLHEGQASSMVFDEAMTRHDKLPFTVKLAKTWAVYYENETAAGAMVKDYYTILQILKDEIVVKEATIEVNKPLYYGGYHFYQHTFGADQFGAYSGLQVTSSRGTMLVFAGYALIFAALVRYFWFGVLRRSAMKEDGRC